MVDVVATLDDAQLADGIARWLAQQHGIDDVVVDEVEHPSVGYSSFTTLLRARWTRDGPTTEHLVVRMAPASTGTFPDYDLVAQHAAQQAAADAGVPIAAPLVTEADPSFLGAPFIVMPRVEGHIVGEAPPFDRWLLSLGSAGQAELHDNFLATLGQIHGAATARAVAGGVPVRDNGSELDYWDRYLRRSAAGAPVRGLVDAVDWCRRHEPLPTDPLDPGLCWGDVRLGNIVFGDDLRPLAVLDWDMAVIGAPEHDLAWFTVLDATMQVLSGRRVDGFPNRDGTIDRYQQLTGRELRDLEWYETFALLRSTAIMTRISILARDSGREPVMRIDDNPLLDLLRDRIGA
jgi:aminoglycoside phosphotransferase (APT) family kinase protein